MLKLVSPWKDHLINFYEYKKLCGYKYDSTEYVLVMFDQYYANLKIDDMLFSRDIIEPFLYLKSNERISNQRYKASVLRQFGKYLYLNNVIENIYIIPPISIKGEKEFIPHIYTKQELRKIVNYLENYEYPMLPGGFKHCPNMLNAVTLCIKILICTGMRLGEVLNLKIKNIEFEQNLFYIDIAKNDNQRIIPISQTLKEEILEYIEKTPFILENHDFLLCIDYENKLKPTNVNRYFYKALNYCGLKNLESRSPRIHDFRHTFAVMSLTQLQKSEENINLSLSYLSTYLGHKSFNETQKYIWMTPIIFEDIKNKMEEYSRFIMDIFGGEKFDEDE